MARLWRLDHPSGGAVAVDYDMRLHAFLESRNSHLSRLITAVAVHSLGVFGDGQNLR
jgi:hypothetical protein